MKETRAIMGMPVTVDVRGDSQKVAADIDAVFDYFAAIDERFSTYKQDSEISRINRSEILENSYSPQMREVFALAEKTKQETNGYFDITQPNGKLDPSGIVKGWAVNRAAALLRKAGHSDFYIDAGGDIQTSGKNSAGEDWSVGIRNPFNTAEVVKVIYPRGAGVATSGSYERGNHIYNPHTPAQALDEVISITVIGPDICEADRFATAAFAMGREGVDFIESLVGFEAYMIDETGTATYTSGFEQYLR